MQFLIKIYMLYKNLTSIRHKYEYKYMLINLIVVILWPINSAYALPSQIKSTSELNNSAFCIPMHHLFSAYVRQG